MKTIKDLDLKPTSFDDDVPAIVIEKTPTFRKMFKAALGMAIKNNGEQAIDLYQLGLKLKQEEKEISLEEAEFSQLKEVCNSNPMGWISHYHAQVMLKLKEAEQNK